MQYFLLIDDEPEECSKDYFYFNITQLQNKISKNKHLHILVTKIENDVSIVSLYYFKSGALKILVGFIEEYK